MTLTARPRLAILFVALAALFLSLTGAPVQAQDDSVPAKPESTEGGRRVSVLKRQEGAPVLLG